MNEQSPAANEGTPEVVPRNGFDLEFLSGHELTLPELDPSLQGDIALTLGGALVRQCTHFSLQMSASRRFCRWVAWNIDGNLIQRLSRGGFNETPHTMCMAKSATRSISTTR